MKTETGKGKEWSRPSEGQGAFFKKRTFVDVRKMAKKIAEGSSRVVGDREKEVASAASAYVRKPWQDPKLDLQRERSGAKLHVQDLAALLAGGQDKLDREAELLELLLKQPWACKKDRYFLTREELYKRGLQVGLGFLELVERHNLSPEDFMTLRKLIDLPGGFDLHFGMYISTLKGMADEEQQKEWLQPALDFRVIGTYAQTELGHGTFLRGLETTASFDKERDEFVVHSPTPTATKWWPGGLGKTATHAVVMARLFLNGRDFGPHPFVMQVRDLATHKPMPGITVGDIGPKLGYNGVDNGFLRFDHVRIPRQQLLQKYSKVTRNGQYVPPPPQNAKSSYATMVEVRADIVKWSGVSLSKATTIAIRYNSIRRQTTHLPGQPEETILNYQQSARNLIPMIAVSYAMHFTGQNMTEMFTGFEREKNVGNFAQLPELHATSCCLKAVISWVTTRGIETCRQSCGGQGYSVLSGLPSLYCNYVQNMTWEGDNIILSLQTARYLIKSLLTVMESREHKSNPSQLAESVKYLGGATRPMESLSDVSKVEHLYDFKTLDKLMSQRCLFLATAAMEDLKQSASRLCSLDTSSSLGPKIMFEGPAWSACHVSLVKVSVAHGWFLMHRSFFFKVGHGMSTLPAASREIMQNLAFLFTLTHIEDHLGDFLEAKLLAPGQASLVHQAVQNLLPKLRTEAVALVDAFAHQDYSLHSAIGSHDGDVYNRLQSMANSNPFNDTQEGPGWEILDQFLNHRSKL